jgi:hypothetical protein
MSLGALSLLLLAWAQAQPAASPSPSPLRSLPVAITANASPAPSPSAAPERPAPPVEVDASGTWRGQTSQGRAVEIAVEGNEVKVLRIAWQIAFDRECPAPDTRLPQQTREGNQLMRYQYPEIVRAGRLKTRLGVGSDLDLVFTGAFAADGTATGDIELATLAGARCSGKVSATWRATRQ